MDPTLTEPEPHGLLRQSLPPTDTYFSQQWHLNGPFGINVQGAWSSGFTGDGVLVAVFDDGIQWAHPDLDGNISNLNVAVQAGGNLGYPVFAVDNHGTAVAGLIAAEADGHGAVGVSHGAQLMSIWQNMDAPTFQGIATGYDYARLYADVLNNSWGFIVPFEDNFHGAYNSIWREIEDAAHFGREGRGLIIVQAAGNWGDLVDLEVNANSHDFTANRFTITVGATDQNGVAVPFTTPGASVLISAPGATGIVTTDRTGTEGYHTSIDGSGIGADLDYTNEFDGTSASAAIVSGVVALMLEANPDLTWRDVQEILAYSARHQGLSTGPDPYWQFTTNAATDWNGGGLSFSPALGFGLVDAAAAVSLAESWIPVTRPDNSGPMPPRNYEFSVSAGVEGGFVQDGIEMVRTIAISQAIDIEHVELRVHTTHPYPGDLTIELISPSGTVSQLAFSGLGVPWTAFTFDSVQFRGEQGQGIWTVRILDTVPELEGFVSNLSVALYGTPSSSDDTYIYTDEFAELAAIDPSRAVLTDAGGIDTVNFAAISSVVLADLNVGSATIDGRILAFTPGSIENVTGGRFNDAFLGSNAANTIWGGSGEDYFGGGGGADVSYGGRGSDRFEGGAGYDIIYGGEGDEWFEWVADADRWYGGAGFDTVFQRNLTQGQVIRLDPTTATGQTEYHEVDLVLAGSGADTVIGGGRDDHVSGGAGNDTLWGGGGRDLLDYTAVAAVTVRLDHGTVQGEGLDAVAEFEDIIAGAGADTLIGNDADNALYGGAGNDVIDGGAGSDTVQFAESSAVGAHLGLGWAFGEGVDDLSGIETLIGSNAADALTGDAAHNHLYGGPSSTADAGDALVGQGGNDHLFGQSGNDVLMGEEGDDLLSGDRGADALIGGTGNDILAGDGGQTLFDGDRLRIIPYAGQHGIDWLDGGAGNDVLHGGGDADLVNGGAGEDVLEGGDGDDAVIGGAGNDWILGGDGNDVLQAGGNDDFVGGELGDDLVDGGDGDDGIVGGQGNDIVSGAGGNDDVSGEAGADVLTGGEGDDSLSGGDDDDSLAGGDGSDALAGGSGYDTIEGQAGDDLIYGGASQPFWSEGFGPDHIYGGAGADTLYGGESDDWLWADNGHDTLDGGAEHDRLFGQDGNDSIAGGDGNDSVSGGAGDDVLDGGQWSDQITGGEGDDTITGGRGGPDTLDGGPGHDVLHFAYESHVSVDLTQHAATGWTGISTDFDTISGFEVFWLALGYSQFRGDNAGQTVFAYGDEDKIDGEGGDDLLHGGGNSDSIYGGHGNDVLYGGGGNDWLWGGSGNDTLYAGVGTEFAEYTGLLTIIGAAEGTITIETSDGIDLLFDFEGIALSTESDTVYIDAGPTALFGDWGDDLFYGGQSNDMLNGGGANDTLFGGNGSDTLYGSYDLDVLTGGDGDDVLVGGHDTSYIGSDQDTMFGGLGDDTIIGGIDNDTLSGGLGNDRMIGGSGHDVVVFSGPVTQIASSNDTLTVVSAEGTDTLSGVEQIVDGQSYTSLADAVTLTDLIDSVDALAGDDTVLLLGGDDTAYGGAGDDLLDAGNGRDRLVGDDGADTLIAGTGDDTVTGDAGSDTVYGGAGPDMLEGGEGDDSVLGDDGSDFVRGGTGNDHLMGGQDDDWLFGGGGDDVLTGGAGSDQFVVIGGETINDFDVTMDAINIAQLGFQSLAAMLAAGGSIIGTDAGAVVRLPAGAQVTLSGVDVADLAPRHLDFAPLPPQSGTHFAPPQGGTVRGSSSSHDTLIGSANADRLDGDYGSDTLSGGAGNDVLTNGSQPDVIFGGSGDDTLIPGFLSADTFWGGSGTDAIELGILGSVFDLEMPAPNSPFLHSVEVIVGSRYGTTLLGSAGSETLVITPGGSGGVLNGRGGDDVLRHSYWSRVTLEGGDGYDIWENHGQGATVNLASNAATLAPPAFGPASVIMNIEELSFRDANLTLTGDELANVVRIEGGQLVVAAAGGNDAAYGGSSDDWLDGQNGNDRLYGGAGNDVVIGGNGNDWMSGGSGGDVFWFFPASGLDTIADWEDGGDLLRLVGFGWTGFNDFLAGGGSISDAGPTMTARAITVSFGPGGAQVLISLDANEAIDSSDFEFA